MSVAIRVHDILDTSLVNGPGKRFVLWTQGCPLNCTGCFNPSAASLQGGRDYELEELLSLIRKADVEGITISGGEPFLQARELSPLIRECTGRGLNSIVYSGFSFCDLKKEILPGSRELLSRIDLLIDGPYRSDLPPEGEWAGSGNQRIIALSENGRLMKRKRRTCLVEKEIIIHTNGELVLTGI